MVEFDWRTGEGLTKQTNQTQYPNNTYKHNTHFNNSPPHVTHTHIQMAHVTAQRTRTRIRTKFLCIHTHASTYKPHVKSIVHYTFTYTFHHIHVHTHSHTRPHTLIHTQTYTQAKAYAYTHQTYKTHTHSHTHIPTPCLLGSVLLVHWFLCVSVSVTVCQCV